MRLLPSYIQGQSHALEKVGAPKWVKMFRQGKLSMENLKKITSTPRGERFLKQLDNQGKEGVVDLITHPKGTNGLAVRKIYAPDSPLYTPDNFRNNIRMQALLGHTIPGNFPKVLGVDFKKKMRIADFIQENEVPFYRIGDVGMGYPHSALHNPAISREFEKRINHFLSKRDLPKVRDVHKKNVIASDGMLHVVDFSPESLVQMPSTKGFKVNTKKVRADAYKNNKKNPSTGELEKNGELR